jgi:NADH-quinone oxidoreductase subunit J
MTALLFYLCSALLLGSALFVVLNRNAVYSVVGLVFAFMNLAVLYFLLEAYFIGILQILVYAGAIMVLFLFVVMLLNVQPDKPRPALIHPDRWWFGLLAGIFIILFLLLLGQAARILMTAPAGDVVQVGDVNMIGETLFSRYLLPFEIASLLLTVALIGTVFLAKRKV